MWHILKHKNFFKEWPEHTPKIFPATRLSELQSVAKANTGLKEYKQNLRKGHYILDLLNASEN